MAMRDQLMADVKAAMIAKDSLKLNTLRFLQAAIKNREIELRPNPITEDDILNVLKKVVKQRKESIEQYKNGGRQDLVDQELAELKVLEVYMPAQLSREQIEAVVVEVVASLNAKTIKDMGAVMKEAVARTSGAADNKILSEVIKAKLS